MGVHQGTGEKTQELGAHPAEAVKDGTKREKEDASRKGGVRRQECREEKKESRRRRSNWWSKSKNAEMRLTQ